MHDFKEPKLSTEDQVKDYYKKLESSKDLQTNACCTTDSIPNYQKEILKNIEPEILDRFYGCGTPIPDVLDGITVLDLGSGTGRDAYLLSKLVGERGHVIGIDMTDEQLDVAKKYQDSQAKRFGFTKSNTTFTKGYIEDLASAGIKSKSVDLVVSNCVINLSPDKPAVFKEIFRVLKEGGEMYISDVFSDRRISDDLRKDPVLYGECLSGALYIEDFRRILNECGCLDYRITETRRLTINNKELEEKLGDIKFYSITVRAFKLNLEDRCEDYGQTVTYKGSMENLSDQFVLDDHHTFKKGEAVKVCGNSSDMILKTRFADHFTYTGDKSIHLGAFDCNPIQCDEPASGGCC
ncbi:methyltransferase type 11 [Candidatus Marinamargulisbacteria bacterium SCGC AAA071-K20]|nr:methyltransferase type 11 [Candidatus Marinamargulisbacteria bacterium SCGC AAA071-K20]